MLTGWYFGNSVLSLNRGPERAIRHNVFNHGVAFFSSYKSIDSN